MNSIVIAPTRPARLRGRVLVVEPDSARAAALREAFRDYEGLEVEIVGRVGNAERALAERMPDVVLTSTLLPPAEAAALTARLNATPGAEHVQIITVPYFMDSEDDDERPDGRVLNFLRRRSALARPRCEARTVRAQIEEYVAKARVIRRDLDDRASRPAVVRQRLTRMPDRSAITAALIAAAPPVPRQRPTGVVLPPDRRRARRRAASDVPWLWSVKVTGASQASIVDISSSGILLETTSRLGDGSTVDLQLVGQDTNLSVAARMVRSQIASVDTLGVRYRVGVAFARELDLLGLQSAPRAVAGPRALGEALTRALAELDRGTGPESVRARFEHELRQILAVRDIQIRQSPVVAEWRTESIYFTIPRGSGMPYILQAIFDPDYAPSAAEFQLLKAAATVASVVLDYTQS